jgi:hypothetical protein
MINESALAVKATHFQRPLVINFDVQMEALLAKVTDD